jgi:quercetin dioxygenase-like cupin family protein
MTSNDIIRIGTIDVRFRVHSAQTAGGMTMFEFNVPAGTRVPVPHSHDAFDETIYGQQGVGTWTLDGEKIRIGAGDVLFIPRGHIHQFENLDNQETRMLSVITPGLLGPEYFHEMAAVINAGGPPDVEKLKEIMRKHGLRPAPPQQG